MKRGILTLVFATYITLAFSQFVYIKGDDFSNYSLGNISPQSSSWVKWNNTAGDGIVTDAYDKCNFTPTTFTNSTNSINHENSLLIDGSRSPVPDIVYTLGNQQVLNIGTDYIQVAFDLYIPSGNRAYYNIQASQNQNEFDGGGIYEIYFDGNGNGRVLSTASGSVGDQLATFDYPQDAWFSVCQTFSSISTEGSSFLVVDGEPITRIPLSTPTIVGGINFFPPSSLYKYYVDCIVLSEASSFTCPAVFLPYCHNGMQLDMSCDFNFCVDHDLFTPNGDCGFDPCEEIIDLPCGITYYESTVGETNKFTINNYSNCYNSENSFAGPDQVFRIQKNNNFGRLVVNLFSDFPSENLEMFLFNECGILEQCIDASKVHPHSQNNGAREFIFSDSGSPLSSGTYYVVVDGTNENQASPYRITATCDNLTCNFINQLECNQPISENTATGDNRISSYKRGNNTSTLGQTGKEIIYELVLDKDVNVNITMNPSPSAGDLDLFILNSCDEYSVIYSSTNSNSSTEIINEFFQAGTYYVVIDGWDSAEGTFDIVAQWDCNTPCSDPTPASCGTVFTNESTLNSSNGFSSYDCAPFNTYNGNEKVYEINVQEKQQYKFVLDATQSEDNLALFLLEECTISDPSFTESAQVGCMASNTSFVSRKVLDVVLDVGIYYVIVDGINASDNGPYSFEVSCECPCVEPPEEMPYASKFLCDDFSTYGIGNSITEASNRWFDNAFNKAPSLISVENDNAFLTLNNQSFIGGNVLYDLEGRTSGRYRLSWRMFIGQDGSMSYNIQDQTPQNVTGSYNYEVRFYENQTGEIYRGNISSAIATFFYYQDAWNEVTQIIDLDRDEVEFWLNGIYLATWTYSTLEATTNLGAINFFSYMESNSDIYRIDDICIWENISNCPTITEEGNSICTNSGNQYVTEAAARCDLYTSSDFYTCTSVCDISGILIYRGHEFSGEFTDNDYSSSQLLQDQCILDAYEGGVVPENAFVDVYTFYNEDGGDVDFNLGNFGENTKGFIFECDCTVVNDEVICTQSCIDISNGLPNGEGFYYLVLIGTENETYTISVFPGNQNCINIEDINCGDNLLSDVFFDSSEDFSVGGSGDYDNCYSGDRTYLGGERKFRVQIKDPSYLSVNVSSDEADLGVFIYDYLCGGNCMTYAEGSAGEPAIIDSFKVTDGIYYIVVDKDSDDTTTDEFTISVNCEKDEDFANVLLDGLPSLEASVDCFTTDSSHLIKVREDALKSPHSNGFNDDYQLLFYYETDNGSERTVVGEEWNNANEMPFNIFEDDPSTDKCSYESGDSIRMALIEKQTNGNNFYKTSITYAASTQNAGIFTPTTTSTITHLELSDPFNLDVKSSEYKLLTADSSKQRMIIKANTFWHIDVVPPVEWIIPDTTDGFNSEIVEFTVKENTTSEIRDAALRIKFTREEDDFFFVIPVSQQRVCVDPAFTITNNIPLGEQICEGDDITLSVEDLSNLEFYQFLWSTQETTSSIDVTAINDDSYSVTVTDTDCQTFATRTFTLQNITTLPDAPLPSSGTTFTHCIGQNPPMIAVNSTQANIKWYDENDILINQGTILTIPDTDLNTAGMYTYYAQAESLNGFCTSENNVEIQLDVSETPSINNLAPTTMECQDEPVFLSVSLQADETIEWIENNEVISTASTILVPSNEPLNTEYTVIVTNSANCTASASTSIEIAENPVVTLSSQNANCEENNGEVITTISGGSGNYSFLWSNNMITQNINNLATGSYDLTVTDLESSCTTVARATIGQDGGINVAIAGAANSICPGESVSLKAIPSGSQAETYLWSTGDTTFDIVVADLTTTTPFSVTVTDVNACTAVSTTIVTVNEEPTVNLVADDPSICLGETVAITAQTVNNTNNFQWSTGDNSNTIAVSPTQDETYTVLVSNEFGCTQVSSIDINVTIPPSISILTTSPTGCSNNTGAITIEVTDGMAPFQYNWSNGQTNKDISNLSAGMYTIIVTDDNDCTAIATATVGTTDAPSASLNPAEAIVCAGFQTQLLLNPSGGTPPYSFNWDQGLANVEDPLVSPTSTTDYHVTITDANDCTTTSFITVTVRQAPAINLTGNSSFVCAGEEIALLSSTQGDVSGVKWEASINGTFVPNEFVTSPSFIPNNENAPSILFTLNAETDGICEAISLTHLVNINSLPTFSSATPECANDNETYSVVFTTNADNIINNTGVLENIGQDQYRIFGVIPNQDISLQLENSITACTDEVVLIGASCDCSINSPISQGDIAVCEGATQDLEVTTVGDVSINWLDEDGNVVGNGVSYSPSIAGTYYAQAIDLFDTDCKSLATEISYTILSNPTIEFEEEDIVICQDETAMIALEDANSAFTYEWSTGETTSSIETPILQETTDFMVTVTDDNGCRSEDIIRVQVQEPIQVSLNEINSTTTVCPDTDEIYLELNITGDYSTIEWEIINIDGIFSSSNEASNVFTINEEITNDVVLSVQVDPAGACDTEVLIELIELNDVPSINNELQECAPDLQSYSLFFESDADMVATNLNAVLVEQLNDGIQLSNIPADTPITITLANSMTACSGEEIYTPNSCPCPNIAAPVPVQNLVTICADEAIPALSVMAISNDYVFNWFDENDIPLMTDASDFIPTSAGIYFVQTEDQVSACTSEKVEIELIIHPVPEVTINAPDILCPDTDTDIEAFISGNYDAVVWNTGETDEILTVNIDENNAFYVTVSNTETGCMSTDSTLISVYELEEWEIVETSSINCFGETGSLQVTGFPAGVEWSTEVDDSPFINDLDAGMYSATITDANGCATVVDYQLIGPDFPLSFTNIVSQSDTMNNEMSGAISGSINGGTADYTINLILEGTIFKTQELDEAGVFTFDSLGIGTYTLELVDANDCVETSGTIIIDIVIAVQNLDFPYGINVFPNPTSDKIYLQLDRQINAPIQIDVFDIMGRSIFKEVYSNQDQYEINFSNQSAGVYFVKCTIDENIWIEKIIVE